MSANPLRALRQSAGLTMVDCCRASGTPYRTWQCWENDSEHGRRVPPIAIAWLRLYLASLGLAPDKQVSLPDTPMKGPTT